MKKRFALPLATSVAVLAGVLGTATPALADHHFMLISEVFVGTVASPGVEAVEIKAYSAGQNFLTGHEIRTYNAAGTQLG